MLEKLDFNFKTFKDSENEFNFYSYNDFISDTINDPSFYNFNLHVPFNVHLVDRQDNVFYCSTLWLITFEDSLYYDSIKKSYEILHYELQKHIEHNGHKNIFGEIPIKIFISEKCVSKIDSLNLFNKMIKAEKEIQKMYRDVEWFDKI